MVQPPACTFLLIWAPMHAVQLHAGGPYQSLPSLDDAPQRDALQGRCVNTQGQQRRDDLPWRLDTASKAQFI